MNKKLMTAAFALCCTVAMMAEKQTVVLSVPEMECGGCKAKVENALAFERGVKKLEYDLEDRTVTIVYEDKRTDVSKLQAALKKHTKFESKVVDKAQEKTSDCKKGCCPA